MGCVNLGTSHTKSMALQQQPTQQGNIQYNTQSVPFNRAINLISSQQAFQPDAQYIQLRKKQIAQFAMHYRIQQVMNIVNKSVPFESVIDLDLKKCNLVQIDYLQVFQSLQTLNLSMNQINHIHNVYLLRNLTSLNLSYNNIIKIQKLHRLTQLKHLYLHNNQILKIQGLDSLINLTQLALGQNKINKIKKLQSLTNLEILGLEMNQIQKIQNLFRLTNLRLLTLGGNKIKRIQNLQSLNNLQILSLEDNQITKIQNIYSMAKHLKQVKIDFNYINLQQQDFPLRQIALSGVLIYVNPQKSLQPPTLIQKILPNFLQ